MNMRKFSIKILVAFVLSLITVFISCRKPAALAARVSPMEALRYVEQTGTKKKRRRSKPVSTAMMAKNNLGRNRKKVVIVTLSFDAISFPYLAL